MENAEIAEIFDQIGDLLDLQEANQFRVRSYRNAAQTVRDLSRRIEDMVEEGEDLSELPNIGEKTADKIDEILETGTCKRLEELKEEMPGDLPELMKIPDVGPKTAEKLHEELDVEDLEGLGEAAEEKEVRELKGLGPKTEENILEGIETVTSVAGPISVGVRDEERVLSITADVPTGCTAEVGLKKEGYPFFACTVDGVATRPLPAGTGRDERFLWVEISDGRHTVEARRDSRP